MAAPRVRDLRAPSLLYSMPISGTGFSFCQLSMYDFHYEEHSFEEPTKEEAARDHIQFVVRGRIMPDCSPVLGLVKGPSTMSRL